MWIVILVGILLVWQMLQGYSSSSKEIPFSQFLDQVASGDVRGVLIKGETIYIKTKEAETSGTTAPRYDQYTYDPGYPDLVKELRAHKVVIEVEKPSDGRLMTALLSWAPLLILVGLWFLFFRQMQSGGTKAMSFGKSKARLLTPDQKRLTFADVAGVVEAKEELEEIIEFLKDPHKFQRLGGKIPKGVLLMGPPGTGKTLLARAVAGEAEVPFFSISGSDFVEMFVGVGASRVRDLFEQGKKNAPCIVFIDEIDAVGRHRGAGLGGGHDEREQTLNQLLVEMDGFESNEGVILIAATNRPDVLDPALLRPGRFDRRIVVNRPDVKGREGILEVHTKKIPLASDVDLAVIARSTPGFSGADLANLVNEAALRAARLNKMKVGMEDFEHAKDKVMMGSERRSLVLSDEEKTLTAYHEAGHALVAAIVPEADPLHKVTIIPRGMALGLTQQLPLEDRYTYKKTYLKANLRVLMGGRLAEELIFGAEQITTGAGNDLERVTDLARKMVCEWGMSESMGPLTFGQKEESIFLGREITRHQDYSNETAVQIDREVRRIVDEAYSGARIILEEHRKALEAVAESLLENEVLDGEEVYDLIEQHSGLDVRKLKKQPEPAGEVSETA
ncbi:MAG TPA: ATP-dependent metallopeptidase FtsH/Yme1/Tma family protein [Acidobacteria bacterium]|nr:ATP-dependent metallopeptidase FtsH/Yme1/Tma family protein [Acidobacteriota bacterium]